MSAHLNIAADQFGFALSADTAFAGMGQIEVLTGGSGQNGFTVAGGKGGLVGQCNGVVHVLVWFGQIKLKGRLKVCFPFYLRWNFAFRRPV